MDPLGYPFQNNIYIYTYISTDGWGHLLGDMDPSQRYIYTKMQTFQAMNWRDVGGGWQKPKASFRQEGRG